MDIKGKRILVVEDEYQLGRQLCDALKREGAHVLGPAPTPFYAFTLLGRRNVDAAVLDIWLHGTTVYELADELVRRGTPILFATTTDADIIPLRYRDIPRVSKPFDPNLVMDTLLAQIQAAVDDRPASPQAITPPADHKARLMRTVVAAVRTASRGLGPRSDSPDRNARSAPASPRQEF